MSWKSLKHLVSSWWFTPAICAVSFAIRLILPHLDLAKSVENLIYPDTGWVGGMTFRLNDVPGYTGRTDVDLILMTHHFSDSSRVTVLRNGPPPDGVSAGAPVSLTLDRPKPRTSGVPLFDLDLPPETLVATSISAPRGAAPSHYVMITPQYSKPFGAEGDLIVMTRNDMLNTRLAYGLSLLALGLAAIFMPRYSHLLHPGDEDGIRSSEAAGG